MDDYATQISSLTYPLSVETEGQRDYILYKVTMPNLSLLLQILQDFQMQKPQEKPSNLRTKQKKH